MNKNSKISISIPVDDRGMIGRECPECKQYFKLKLGTGIKTDNCNCPYCEYEGHSNNFFTKAQIEYAKTVAINQFMSSVIKPQISKMFKNIEQKNKKSLISFKYAESKQNFTFPIRYYIEEELETKIICDNCGLEFSIYGFFARCPDCQEINAFLIFNKSIEAIKKQLAVLSKPEIPDELRTQFLGHIVSSCVSTFDALGKELRKRKPQKFPKQPKNLFQNLSQLDNSLNGIISTKHSNYSFLIKMFQVRHIFEHNLGVIDENFSKKVSGFKHLIGRKYNPSINELML